MRIIHVITRLLRAGSEENTLASCRAQAARGHDVHVIHGDDYDPDYHRDLSDVLTFHALPSLVHPLAPRRDLKAAIALTRAFRDLRPDLVHTHQSKAGIIGRMAARAAGVPVIIHGVHILPFVNVGRLRAAGYLLAERVAGAFTHAFIDVSSGMRDLCLAHGIGGPDNHHVIHSGFSVARFRSAEPPEDWRRLLRLPPSAPRPPVIVMMASFEPRKRHEEFLTVVKRVTLRFPDLRLLLVGDGPRREHVAARIRELGLDGNVIRTGFRHDPERLVALADFCLLTSAREGLPRVILQYLAAGKPCVVSDLPGLEEVLEHNRNALIAPAEDLEAAADAMIELLANRDKLQSLAQAAADTDISSWDVDLMCERIEAVYAELIGQHRARPIFPFRLGRAA